MTRRVIVAGFFSARVRDHAEQIEALVGQLTAHGDQVVATLVQRRGVSRARHPGGARHLDHAPSAALYFGTGKAREIAQARQQLAADRVVVLGAPTDSQREHLQRLVGCPVVVSAGRRETGREPPGQTPGPRLD